jgi:hypothetical protein
VWAQVCGLKWILSQDTDWSRRIDPATLHHSLKPSLSSIPPHERPWAKGNWSPLLVPAKMSETDRSWPGSRRCCLLISLLCSQVSGLRIESHSFPWSFTMCHMSMHTALPLYNLHGPSSSSRCVLIAVLPSDMANNMILFCTQRQSDGVMWGNLPGQHSWSAIQLVLRHNALTQLPMTSLFGVYSQTSANTNCSSPHS